MVKRMEKYKKFWESVDIEYTEKVNKLSDILDTAKNDAVSYVKNIENSIDK